MWLGPVSLGKNVRKHISPKLCLTPDTRNTSGQVSASEYVTRLKTSLPKALHYADIQMDPMDRTFYTPCALSLFTCDPHVDCIFNS